VCSGCATHRAGQPRLASARPVAPSTSPACMRAWFVLFLVSERQVDHVLIKTRLQKNLLRRGSKPWLHTSFLV
jgi:hypothetical protein